ncbi:hypothetical protein NX059_008439 [Plenodomus lindquistii]|nr:hypothetical protein NX059_008439 [Plenodomus lindquistii]
MDDLSEQTLITRFDQLVDEGIIIYGPHETIHVEAEGYPLTFRICPTLTTKPPTITASNPLFSSSQKWGPGSDLFIPTPRLILTQLHSTHDLALNLFCVDRPQLLLLTLDSYARQHEALDATDFAAMLSTLTAFPSLYTIFNCGERGGCSRVHKHMQGLRGPPHAFDHVVGNKGKAPFLFFTHFFENGFHAVSAEDVVAVYVELLDKTRDVLRWEDDGVQPPPHNVVMWRDWMIVVPRRKGSFAGASANAGGMLGSVWVSGKEHVDKWADVGYAEVLRELGVPA